MYIVLPPTHIRSSELGHSKSDDSIGDYSTSDNKLKPTEANSPEITISRGLISLGWHYVEYHIPFRGIAPKPQ